MGEVSWHLHIDDGSSFWVPSGVREAGCFPRHIHILHENTSPDLVNVFAEVVKIVNHIRGSATNSRIVKALCERKLWLNPV